MGKLTSRIFNMPRIMKKIQPIGEIPDGNTLLKQTLKMAWPSTLEAFLLALVSFVDLWMISSLGDNAIAGVGLTTQPRLICIAAFTALSPAVSAIVARRRGEGDRDSAVRVLKIALLVSAVLISIISILSVFFAGQLMTLSGSQPGFHRYATDYFSITMGGMIFNVLTIIINAAQRGAGNTKIAMATNVTSNAVNIILNFILIGGRLGAPALGVVGAAIATVCGQLVAFVMAVISVMRADGFVCIRHKVKSLLEKRTVQPLWSLGSSSFLEQIILRAGFLMYAIIVANLGEVAFATHNIGIQFMMISFSFGDGLSVAAISLVGRSLGENRVDLAKIYGAFCQRLGIMCSCVLSVIYIVFGRAMFSLFSDTEQVLNDGTIIMMFMTLIVMFQISQLVYTGCLRGGGDIKFTALVSLVGIGLLRPILAYMLSTALGFGVIGAWAGLVLDQIVRMVMTSVRFSRGKWADIKI